jgi:hypothetical protein
MNMAEVRTNMKISDLHRVQKRFFRSANLERDFYDPSALSGYIATPQVSESIARINAGLARNSGQRSWRITGDYGSGKSSFALLLAQLYARQEKQVPASVRTALQEPIAQIRRSNLRFAPLLVTGSREPLATALIRSVGRALNDPNLRTGRTASRMTTQIKALLAQPNKVDDQQALNIIVDAHAEIIRRGDTHGLLIILDELGKFLEFASFHPERQDVFLLQQLSELATRSNNSEPVFLIGLLHQGFSTYAEMLSRSAKREWEKIAGRFEELLFDQPLDQISGLVGAALGVILKDLPPEVDKALSAAMREAVSLGWYGQYASSAEMAHKAALLYPLHPTVIPVLLKLLSRWGQNERSLFSFLLSSEPFGLREFSQQNVGAGCYYLISDLYDYAAYNLSYSLGTQSYRSHWNHIDSLVRSFRYDSNVDLAVLKTIGLLNLINSPELVPNEEAIILAVSDRATIRPSEVRQALHRLHNERHVLYLRGRAGGYCLWSHTSINLDSAYEDAGRATMQTQRVAASVKERLDSRPIVARRHYIQTGNLRCFGLTYCDISDLASEATKMVDDVDGRIIIPLCETQEERTSAVAFARQLGGRPDVLIGLTEPLICLKGLVHEVDRWNWVEAKTPELREDRYAAEEVTRQLTLATHTLQKRLEHYVGVNHRSKATETDVDWYYEGRLLSIRTGTGFQSFLSELCDKLFPDAPRLHNELINRRSISPSATLARTRLIDRIFAKTAEPLLGMDPHRKPPEMAIYMSLLKAGSFHVQRDGRWIIKAPASNKDTLHLLPALREMTRILHKAGDSRVSLPTLFARLRARPFGIKEGLLPLILAIYLRINWHRTALYEDGTYLHSVGGLEFVRLAKEPEHFEIQHCAIEGVRAEVFQRLVEALGLPLETEGTADLLDIVRPLVTFIAQLPDYSRRTSTLSQISIAVRKVLLEAREPSRLIFCDLPTACGFPEFALKQRRNKTLQVDVVEGFAEALQKSMREIQNSYDRLLDGIEATLLGAFGSTRSLQSLREELRSRCTAIMPHITDSSVKSFVFRLVDSGLQRRHWLESLGSLLARKPPERWLDQDETEFQHQLSVYVGRLNRIETLLFCSGMQLSENSCRLVMTRPDGTEVEHLFQWNDTEMGRAAELEKQITELLDNYGNLGLAVAAKAVWGALKR